MAIHLLVIKKTYSILYQYQKKINIYIWSHTPPEPPPEGIFHIFVSIVCFTSLPGSNGGSLGRGPMEKNKKKGKKLRENQKKQNKKKKKTKKNKKNKKNQKNKKKQQNLGILWGEAPWRKPKKTSRKPKKINKKQYLGTLWGEAPWRK